MQKTKCKKLKLGGTNEQRIDQSSVLSFTQVFSKAIHKERDNRVCNRLCWLWCVFRTGTFYQEFHRFSAPALFCAANQGYPKKGDLTLVYNQFYGRRLIKKIIGHEGDRLHQDRRGNLWVGGYLVGKVYPQTAKGQKFTPTPDQVIPKGRVFFHSPHPQSFDSRFQEVGLVHANDLEGRLIAVM